MPVANLGVTLSELYPPFFATGCVFLGGRFLISYRYSISYARIVLDIYHFYSSSRLYLMTCSRVNAEKFLHRFLSFRGCMRLLLVWYCRQGRLMPNSSVGFASNLIFIHRSQPPCDQCEKLIDKKLVRTPVLTQSYSRRSVFAVTQRSV